MRAATAAILVALVGCGPPGQGETTVGPTTPASTATTSTTTPVAGCPESVDFVEQGRVMGLEQLESDSSIVGLITWTESPLCEQFEIGFETVQGAPATTPPDVRVQFIPTLQVIRVHLGSDGSVLHEQTVETALVDRLFVVHKLDGSTFVDFHLRQPVRARARVSNSPAKVVLDLQPGTGGFDGMAAIAGDVIMTSPSDGATTSTNIEVSGYAMSTTGAVTVIATADGRVVAEATIEVGGDSSEWSEYRTRLTLPVGTTTVFAGETSPVDGGLEGVTVAVEAR
jgi:hypothetical protein